MAKIRKYKFNRETLIYEPAKGSLLSKLRRALLYFLFSIALSSLYFFAYTSLFKLGLQNTFFLNGKMSSG